MNVGLARERISGLVVDVGGARDPDYFSYLQADEGVKVEPVDGMLSGINFETDPLPYETGSTDTVLMCNILEHIYNHRFLTAEAYRILRSGGRLVGFVPFWVSYHPDPHDYFRYTPEALEKIFTEAGFTNVSIRKVGSGPLMANFNTIVLSIPRVVRPVVYLWYAAFDRIYITLRPESVKRNPLGFIFTAEHA
jgi:SAM-dependent methyltransferase